MIALRSLAAIASLTAIACSASAPRPSEGEPPPLLGFDAPTTDGAVALHNLSAGVGAAEEALVRRPDLVAFRQELVSLLLARVTYTGSYGDLEKLDALTAGPLASGEDAPELHRLRARYLSLVHDFTGARRHLARAEETGAAGVDGERAIYAVAEGLPLDGALALRERAAALRPAFDTFFDLATVLAARGDFDRADQTYLRALEAYRDVSPFPVASVLFQRGVMWAEKAGRPERARPLYEEAVRRLPGFVAANVHLAEIQLADGDPAGAVARLRPIAAASEDPEPHGRLAEWTRRDDPMAARAHADEARRRYERLLGRFPYAFADHASEFFRAAGQDPARAAALADENLTRRRDARAYLLALSAAEAAGNRARACALAAEAPAEALAAHVPLRELAAATRRTCRR